MKTFSKKFKCASILFMLGMLCSCSLFNGDKGIQGEKGDAGKDGTTLLYGEGVPSTSLGKEGDSYIDKLSYDYYTKLEDSWEKKGNIKGKDGSSLLIGKGAPSEDLADDGDSYYDELSHDFYLKDDESWEKKANMAGDSAYEIYLKYHPGYCWGEESWQADLENKNLYNHISFETFNGTPVDDLYFYKGDTVEVSSFASPTLEHASFSGWYYDSSFTSPASQDFLGENSLTLYAKFDWDKFNITLLMDGSIYDSYQLEYGSSLTLPKVNPGIGHSVSPWVNQKNGEVWTNGNKVETDLVFECYRSYDQLELPIVSIETKNRSPIVSKENYIGASFSILDEEGKSSINNASGKIKGRGNSSWYNSEKKGYKLKFDKKTSLFGSSYKAKTWTLIANQTDKSLSRNYLAYELSSSFSNIEFTTMHRYVDVYLNGSYNGVYLLCDQVESGEGRVDIDESLDPTRDDIAFLIEKDYQNRLISDGGKEDVDYFSISDDYFDIKTPDTEDSEYLKNSSTYISQIKGYMESCLNALNSSYEEAKSLIDVESFAETYIIQELFENVDAGGSSFYLYKDIGGLLKSGPVWDFDASSGNVNYAFGNENSCPADGRLWAKERCVFYRCLLSYPEFESLVQNKLYEYEDRIKEVIALSDINNPVGTYQMYKDAFLRNFSRWKIMGQYIYPEPYSIYSLTSVEDQLSYLNSWLTTRLNCLEIAYPRN